LDEFVQDCDAGWGGEGEAERLFVAVDGEEVGAFADAGFVGFSRVGGVGGTPFSGVVAAGGVFDFDDFCSGGGVREKGEGGLGACCCWYPRSPRICVQYGYVKVS
jgi:hypothetical protein